MVALVKDCFIISNSIMYNKYVSRIFHKISHKIILFSFISCQNDPILIKHWIHHYLSFGINTSASLIIFDNTTKCDISKYFKLSGFETSYVNGYTSDQKKDLVNKFIKRSPRSSYLMYPDSDEFFTYNDDTVSITTRGMAIKSTLTEMLPYNNALTCVNHRNIFTQYPKECNKLSYYLGVDTRKITLLPVYTDGYNLYSSSHNLQSTIPVYKSSAPIYHFRYNCNTPHITLKKYYAYKGQIIWHPLTYSLRKSIPAAARYYKEYSLYKKHNNTWYIEFDC